MGVSISQPDKHSLSSSPSLRLGGFRLLKLQALRGDPAALFLITPDAARCADFLPRLLYLVAEIRHQWHSVTPICRESKIDSNSWGKTENATCFSQQRVKNFPWTLLSSTEAHYMDPQDVLWSILFLRVYFNSLISMQKSFQMATIHETISMIGSSYFQIGHCKWKNKILHDCYETICTLYL